LGLALPDKRFVAYEIGKLNVGRWFEFWGEAATIKGSCFLSLEA
jgi:hypothetical protein